MLFQMIENVCGSIERTDFKKEVTAMRAEIERSAPDTVSQMAQSLKKSGGKKQLKEAAATVLAALAVGHTKSIPILARTMVEKVRDGRVPAVRRCAVAGLLAYFVQPHDLIPDSSPGGYGFIDDLVLIRAGFVEYLNTLPTAQSKLEDEQRLISLFTQLAPQQVRPALQQGIEAMSSSIQIMGMLDEGVAEMILMQVIATPLMASPPAAPQGFAPRPAYGYDRGHWSGGAYFEGDNVIISGGPSLINGQLFIPG